MTATVLTFFNNKGGVGKTSLVYHLAWMYAETGKRVLVADLDPQANLTAAFLDDEELEALWEDPDKNTTVYKCLKPITEVSDLLEPELVKATPNLYLLPGDVGLSRFEDELSSEWPKSLSDRNLYRPMRILSSFWQLLQMGAKKLQADIILVDVGPNLGAINRSALIATDFVVIPLGADLFSLQGLKNLGPALHEWHSGWARRIANWKESHDPNEHQGFELPNGSMRPLGYICQQYGIRLDRPVQSYEAWLKRIPETYSRYVLDEPTSSTSLENDPNCLATIKHYRSLVPMSQESRKPIFSLTSADGAIGAHANAVRDAKRDFQALANTISERLMIPPDLTES